MTVYDRKHKEYVNILDVMNISLTDTFSTCWIIFKTDKSAKIFVNCSCSRENKKKNTTTYTVAMLTLFNKLVKPNDWFTVPGFLEAYLGFKKRAKRLMVFGVFTPDLLGRKIKKFERKLTPENKLLLEVCND